MGAQIPRMGQISYLPGLEPEKFDPFQKKPETLNEAIKLLRNKELGYRVTIKWNEDVDVMICNLKVEGMAADGGISWTIELTPGEYAASAPKIIKAAQELWAARKRIVDGISFSDGVK